MTRKEAASFLRNVAEGLKTLNINGINYSTLETKLDFREALYKAAEALENSQNCVKCEHYYETVDERGIHSHCRKETE